MGRLVSVPDFSNIENARNRVFREMAATDADNEAVVMNGLHAMAFQNTSLALPVIGRSESLSQLTREDCQNYVNTHFKGPRIVVAVAGDVHHDDAVKSVDKSFSKITSLYDKSEIPILPRTRYTGSDIRIRDDAMPLAHIVLAVEGAPRDSNDAIALNLAAEVSLLYITCRFRNSSLPLFDNLVVERMKQEDLLWHTTYEWKRYCMEITDNELNRGKNLLVTKIMRNNETPTAVANNTSAEVLTFGRRVPLGEWRDRVLGLKAARMRDTALFGSYFVLSSVLSPTMSGQRRHEYKTLIEVHNLFPVSGKTYCHIYGVLRYRDFKKNTIHLRDEKAFTSTIQLRPGNSSFRHYPAFRPGDIVRIHRVLLAPNCMDIICCDPKDVVVFEAFQDSQCFSPINTSVRPTFESFDRQRKEELNQWFADDLLADSLSEKKSSTNYHLYADLAVQVLRVTTTRDRTELVVWDTTPPALRTYRSDVSTADMGLDSAEEELIRIVNENQMSIVVTVFEQHSNDAQSIKPFDFIVLFNVSVRADRFRDGFYMYSLNSGYHFGKCIRFVKPNAYLSKRLYDKIEEYKVMSAVNVGTPSIEDAVLSQSFPADSQDVSTFPAAVDQSAMFSDMADFEMDLHEVIDELENKRCPVVSCIGPIEQFEDYEVVRDDNHESHGQKFHEHMYRINRMSGTDCTLLLGVIWISRPDFIRYVLAFRGQPNARKVVEQGVKDLTPSASDSGKHLKTEAFGEAYDVSHALGQKEAYNKIDEKYSQEPAGVKGSEMSTVVGWGGESSEAITTTPKEPSIRSAEDLGANSTTKQ
ncbi:unnamed protein product, partial [Medioppia subpectinata]